MSRGAEDRLRDLLNERAGDVSPATDWEDRVLVAGKRRRLRRRIGAGVVAAAVVALAAVGANAVLRPLALDKPEIATTPTVNASPTTPATPTTAPDAGASAVWTGLDPAVSALPEGLETNVSYALAKQFFDGYRLVTYPDRILDTAGPLDGAVIFTRNDDTHANTLWYRDAGWTTGRSPKPDYRGVELARGTISGFGVGWDDANNGRVAWGQQTSGGWEFRVVELASSKVVAQGELPGEPSKVRFLDGNVLFEVNDKTYLWSGQGKVAPWRLGGKAVGTFLEVSEQAGLVLVHGSNVSCVTALRLSDGSQAWSRCSKADFPGGLAFSPGGKYIASASSSRTVAFVTSADGKAAGRHELGEIFVEDFVWDGDDSVLGVSAPAEGAPHWPGLFRCQVGVASCDRVPLAMSMGKVWNYPFTLTRSIAYKLVE